MDTSADQAAIESAQKSTDLARFAPLADTASKGVAAVAIALYACGYLITSLHHARYGFISTDPFRPRILAAGFWFLFFSSIPIAAAIDFEPSSPIEIARNSFFFWTFGLGLSIPLQFLFNFEHYSGQPLPTNRLVTAGIVAFGILVIVALNFAINSKKVPRWVGAVSAVAMTLFLTVVALWDLLVSHNFTLSSVILWFFGVFIVTVIGLKLLENTNLLRAGQWSKPLPIMFVALLVFAQYFYPHIKSSWAGGQPVTATIYFAKDSIVKPGQAVPAELIEESDQGFYIVGSKETKAVFVPRNAVALIYFSDDPKKSSLLGNGK